MTLAVVAVAAAVCGPPAAAQDVTCDVKKSCVTDHINYDPDDERGFVVFDNVGVFYDDHPVWKLIDKPGADIDGVYIEIGACKMDIIQPHTPIATPEEDPDFRRRMARDAIDSRYGRLKKTASVLNVSEPTLLKDEPGLVQYQVVSEWIGDTGSGSASEVRRVTVGYYQVIEKWCKGADEETAQRIYDEHRVKIHTAPDE